MDPKSELTGSSHPDSAYLLEQAHAIAPLVRSSRDETDRLQRTPPAVVKALRDAGLFRMWMPRALGGFEADPRTFYGVLSEIAAADGSTGWNLMNGANYSLMAFYLREDVGREIFGPRDTIAAGQIAPNGKAVAVDGGYRVSGRWGFGSGIHHATWIASGCIVFDGEAVRTMPNGMPSVVHVMTPPGAVKVDEDSWHVSGLRGTGSCDYSMDDVFVPDDRTFSLCLSRRYHAGPPALISRSMFGLSISAVSIGIARAAIDALVTLAATKKATGAPVLMRERPEVQRAIAHASGLVTAAQAYVLHTSEDIWRSCAAGQEPSLEQNLAVRAASVLAPRMCAEAVDLVWQAGGAASVREANVIERCFRDIHAATQHFAISEPFLLDTGRGLAGLDPQMLPL